MRKEKAMCMSFKTYDIDDVHKSEINTDVWQ